MVVFRIVYYDPTRNIKFSIYLMDYEYYELVSLAERIATSPRGYIRRWEEAVRKVYERSVPREVRGYVPFRYFAYGWLLWKLIGRKAEILEERRYRYSWAIDFRVSESSETSKTPAGTIFSIRASITTAIPLPDRDKDLVMDVLRKVARFVTSLFPSLYQAIRSGKVSVREGAEEGTPESPTVLNLEPDIKAREIIRRRITREMVRQRCTRVAERVRKKYAGIGKEKVSLTYTNNELKAVEDEIGTLRYWGEFKLEGTREEKIFFVFRVVEKIWNEAMSYIYYDPSTAGRILLRIVLYHATSDPPISSWNFAPWYNTLQSAL